MTQLADLGHYCTPRMGGASHACQTALVTRAQGNRVNLIAWEADGDHFVRWEVVVGPPDDERGTWHPASECPYGR